MALLKNGVSSELVADEIQRIAGSLIDQELIWRAAINFLKKRLSAGIGAVLSTTNYHEGAVGFLLALHHRGWINQPELKSIVVSGSTIDWSSRTVVHFNMGRNKVIGLMDALGIGAESVKTKIAYAFGDHPWAATRVVGGSPHPYVIKNENNRYLNLPARIKLAKWAELEALSV